MNADTTSAGTRDEKTPPRREGATLTVEDLSVHYGGVCAVSSIGFTVEPGQSVGIIGANGAGKTSTLKALMGLVPRSGGRVTFGDTDLAKVRARDVVRHGIGYVPEGRHVFPGLTVEKNLMLGAYARSWRDTGTRRPSPGSTSCSRCWRRCGPGSPAPCPAGSSRCWPSAGR